MSFVPPTVNSLGVLIPSAKVRLSIYGTYVVALIVAGAVGVFFSSTHYVLPDWFDGVNAVLQYLGIPVGALAAANAVPALKSPAPTPVIDPTTTGGD